MKSLIMISLLLLVANAQAQSQIEYLSNNRLIMQFNVTPEVPKSLSLESACAVNTEIVLEEYRRTGVEPYNLCELSLAPGAKLVKIAATSCSISRYLDPETSQLRHFTSVSLKVACGL